MKNYCLTIGLIILSLLLLAGRAVAAGNDGVITAKDWGDKNRRLFTRHVLVWWSDTTSMAAEQAYRDFQAFQANGRGNWNPLLKAAVPRFSKNVSFWAGVRIVNDGVEPQKLYFRNGHTTVKDASLVIGREGRIIDQAFFGDLHSPSAWPIRYHQFTYPITLKPGEQIDLLMHAQSATFPNVTIERSILATEVELALSEDPTRMVIWAVVGALILLGFLSLVAALRLQSRQFAILAVISLAGSLMQLDFQGYLEYYLWPDSTFLKSKSLLLFSIFMLPSTVWFFVDHLSLREKSVLMYRVVAFGTFLMAAIYGIGLFLEEGYNIALAVASWLWMLMTIGLLMLAFYFWRQGSAIAGRMLIIWSLYVLLALFASVGVLLLHNIHVYNLLVANLTIMLLTVFLFVTAFIELREHQQARDLALAESQAKSQFLARMSHEIRTPMNGVLGMAELLAETHLDKTQKNYVSVIYNSGRTLLGVINEILDFSKITAGKMKLDIAEADITSVVEECVRLFLPQARGKKLELICAIDPDMPSLWAFDEVRVRQILFNLLGNAIKFTERGEIVLTIEPLPDDRGIAIKVSDTGIGITRAQQESLFDAFSQADVSTSRRYGGTGLGLAICSQLVALMDGTITVKSRLGEGASFLIELPLKKVTGPYKEFEINQEFSNKRVLIVDDNTTALGVLKAQARHCGLTIETAAGGRKAIEKVRDAHRKGEAFDLVLSDIDMPGMDGYRLAEELTARTYSPPVVLQSSTTDLPDQNRCRELGVKFACAKPQSVRGMCSLLARAFDFQFIVGQQQTNNFDELEDGGGLSVLVAEDNTVNFQVVSTMLIRLGYTVDHALDGQDTISHFIQANIKGKNSGYDLILMDCEMPGVNGFEATAEIRMLEKENALKPIPIIALTAHVMDDVLQRCRESGMDDYLSKPVQLKMLARKLKVFTSTANS